MAAELKLHLDLCLAAIRAAEAGPSPEELEAAPLMENWCVLRSPSGSPVLWGKVINHPCLGTKVIASPQLVALDAKLDWARSLCGWFTLGKPFAPALADLKRGYPRSVLGRALEEFEMSGFMVLGDAERHGVIMDELSAGIMRPCALL